MNGSIGLILDKHGKKAKPVYIGKKPTNEYITNIARLMTIYDFKQVESVS